ncbi:hypothetical protein ARMGADRAFT_1082268 [Armillaria gallica]|uniref:Uncharacterized protein n=1 Tax=Armillaria gallica TaxID=47427 RepID=A0A2H3D718_ARMGA|nr:hypothetical protein ARMGADRAFT_1082268 [Armillaria gallica]
MSGLIVAIMKEHLRRNKVVMHLSRLYRDMGGLDGVYIKLDDGEQTWHLAKRDKETGESEEMVFTATSTLAHMDLLPITRETMGMKEKLRFLSQSIMITGFGRQSFDHTIKAIKEIQCTGKREFHQGQLQEWLPSKFQGHDAIEMSNQYFRAQSKSEQEIGTPIGQDMDPRGVLAQLAGSNLIHMEENNVNYYRGLIEGSKKRQVGSIHINGLEANSLDDARYVRVKPQMFRVGDIVEAQCSVIFMRCKGNGANMKLIL